MRRIIGTIGATLAIVTAMATPAGAQDADLNPGAPQVVGSAYASHVDGDGLGDETQDPDGGGLGSDWEDDWFEDYEEGDLDQEFIAQSISPRTWWAALTPSGGESLGSD